MFLDVLRCSMMFLIIFQGYIHVHETNCTPFPWHIRGSKLILTWTSKSALSKVETPETEHGDTPFLIHSDHSLLSVISSVLCVQSLAWQDISLYVCAHNRCDVCRDMVVSQIAYPESSGESSSPCVQSLLPLCPAGLSHGNGEIV